MKVRSTLSLAILATVMALPAVSMASSNHLTYSESGYVYWDHFKSTKTRAEVVAELEAAIKDGSYRRMQLQSLGFFTPSKGTKTREQVRQELFSMTAAEKAEAAKQYSNGGAN
jgi:hypothetical protein